MVQASYARGENLPTDVFEELSKCHKKVATELMVFDTVGRILLIRRPGLEESPAEAFPGQLHGPGVTHKPLERAEDAWQRLKEKELGGAVILDGPHRVDDTENIQPPRGMILQILHIVLVDAETLPENEKQSFYCVDSIPWDELVTTHRDVLVPSAVVHARVRGWVK
jgi:hypothetical protein